VLITGPSGSGKSFVAQALGQHACRSGFTTQYLRLPTLLNHFVQARAEGIYDRLLKRLAKTSVLVIDDLRSKRIHPHSLVSTPAATGLDVGGLVG
jgi:DNA replication protein DnaC